MPWKETDPVKERNAFIWHLESGLYTMKEVCDRFGVSRKTGYKWRNRHEREGTDGLRDRSRRPHSSPTKVPDEVEDFIVALRKRFKDWGPRKIHDYIVDFCPEVDAPAVSTVAAVLKRRGLIEQPRRRRRHRHPGRPSRPVDEPNELWTADFKGQFPTGDGVLCYPLTVADQYSRFLFAVKGLPSVRNTGVRPVFERLFRDHGLPSAIRTDNGSPFATNAICGLSALNVWWIQLGIRHERIEPGQPQQNGVHERMHRSLKRATTRPPEANARLQQAAFDDFRHTFNNLRSHEGLDGRRPAEVWNPSPRSYPEKIQPPDYPGYYFVRKVSNAGTFRFKSRQLFISQALAQHRVGMEEIDDGIWSIYFYDVLLGRLNERTRAVVG